jgi:hypothetical protein
VTSQIGFSGVVREFCCGHLYDGQVANDDNDDDNYDDNMTCLEAKINEKNS